MIGMPGAGKSTIGVVLAKNRGYQFVDSDLVIQERYDKLLHQLITEHGLDGFIRIEEEVNASLQAEKSIIATGGSVVYGPKAMEHLKEIGTVVYLKLSYESIEERLGDLKARGVAFGRPKKPKPDDWNEILAMWGAGLLTKKEAARLLGVCVATFNKWLGTDRASAD